MSALREQVAVVAGRLQEPLRRHLAGLERIAGRGRGSLEPQLLDRSK